MARCPKCNVRLPPLLVTAVSVVAAGCMVACGILGLVFFDIWRFAVNIFLVLFGLVIIVCDIRAFRFMGYMKFIYTSLGRGVFFVCWGCVALGNGIVYIVFGAAIVVLGCIFAIAAALNGGVPKPFLQRNVDELPLNTELRFIEPANVSNTIPT
eukprot:GHVT01039647.1.p1 GENE.GHVT01039647.1~~GHVT01039647.1.p1  ORF type:complete len:154 (+),score=3.51 GHVT01039647.1:100-561(+)